MGIFKKLLAAAKKRLAPNEKLRLSWNEGSVCCLMDREGVLVYCVVTSLVTYPERLAYQLLYDLVVAVNALDQSEVLQCGENALTGKLMQRMKELVKQYEDRPQQLPDAPAGDGPPAGQLQRRQRLRPRRGRAPQRQTDGGSS
ncbi:unnamed protein product [Prorocentrum cordatum]|uniref:Coatomer subunit zeta n=1 Tax=Prorocentrum cordatum TaxID=2364126 RepID=A0ABN9T9E6_9DINO|nr:unnamed protein product [Polarella glacialis]